MNLGIIPAKKIEQRKQEVNEDKLKALVSYFNSKIMKDNFQGNSYSIDTVAEKVYLKFNDLEIKILEEEYDKEGFHFHVTQKKFGCIFTITIKKDSNEQ